MNAKKPRLRQFETPVYAEHARTWFTWPNGCVNLMCWWPLVAAVCSMPRSAGCSSAERRVKQRDRSSLERGPAFRSCGRTQYKAHKPVLKRFDDILGSQALNNLRLRQPVSQSLTLGISHHGSHLEENGDDIRSRKKKEKVSSYRTSERRRAASFEADHNQAKKELPYALPSYRVPEQQVGSASRKVQDEVRSPVQQTAHHDHEAVYGRGKESPQHIGLCVWRTASPSKAASQSESTRVQTRLQAE